jgi:transmembrane sensor
VTSTARIRAVGTRFDVYQHPNGVSPTANATTVSVLDGVVQITPETSIAEATVAEPSASSAALGSSNDALPVARLAAGEQANISRAGVTRKVASDVADAIAWRDRVLVFQGASIADVAAEYNRYNTSQVRIEDAEIEQNQLSGTYSADRPENLVRYLQEAFPVTVRREGNDWIVQRR